MAYEINPNLNDSQRLAAIEVLLKDGFERLFGNGQPGEVEKLRGRVASLERYRWMLAGGVASLSAVVGVITAYVIKRIG